MTYWKNNLYTLWISQIISLTSFGLGLPFMAFYIQKLGITDPTQIKFYTGILAAAPALTMGLMAPIWGMIGDRIGNKFMLLRAMFSASIILTAMGLVSNVTQLIILRFFQGMLTGTVTASGALIASNTPEDKLSYALGFISSSTFIGYAAGPAIGGFIAELMGYRMSFYIGGILMFLGFLLVLFMVKEDKKQIQKRKSAPLNLKGSLSIFTPTVVSMFLILLFIRIARTIFNPYLPLFLEEISGTSIGVPKLTGIINSLAGVATAIAGLTISKLGDKKEGSSIIVKLSSIGIIISIGVFMAPGTISFTILNSLMFLFIGGIEPIVMSINSKNVPLEKRGSLFGFQALMGSIGWALAPMMGSAISIHINIHMILSIIPISLILTLFIALMSKKFAH
jgi:DHA1 family multidrug resistance protein-like MFS transporter